MQQFLPHYTVYLLFNVIAHHNEKRTRNVYFQNTVQLMCPISPMLAEPCKSVEKAIEKCPAGIYSEIKYDGERVQLHKKGNEFKCVFLYTFFIHVWRGCVNEIVSITPEFKLYFTDFFQGT